MVSHHSNPLSYDSSNSRPNSYYSHVMPMAAIDRQHHQQEISYNSSTPRQTSHLPVPLVAHSTFDRHLPNPELNLPPSGTYLTNDIGQPSSHAAPVPQLLSHHYTEPVYNQFFLSPSVPNSSHYSAYNQGTADYPIPPASYAARPGPATGGSRLQYTTMAGHELLPPLQLNAQSQVSQAAYSTPPLFSSPSFETTHATEPQHVQPSQFSQPYPLSRSGSRDSVASIYSHALTPETGSYVSVPSNHSDSQTSAAAIEVPHSTSLHFIQSQERPSVDTQPRQPLSYGRLVTSPPSSYPIAPSTFQAPRIKRELDEKVEDSSDDDCPSPVKNDEHVSPVPSRKPSKESIAKRGRTEPAATRTSRRIASMGRTSYADLENGATPSPTASFGGRLSSPPTDDEEDDFRPQKRTRAPGVKKKGAVSRRPSATPASQSAQYERSLWGLDRTYPELQSCYPLFYHALNHDLSLNMDAVPLIGTIPATVSPEQKAARLRSFFHRGRRILAQLDAFTRRCDRRYEGPSQRWPDLDEGTRLAIRDVRRKAVERCENYKYTRRDILDKLFGKSNWDPIETDMIVWHEDMANSDPAGDLQGGKMDTMSQPGRRANEPVISYRAVRPMPSRGRLSSATVTNSSTGGVHGKPTQATAAPKAYEPSPSPPVPQYGEDEVPLTVQLPGISSPATARGSPYSAAGPSTWAQDNLWEDNEVVVPGPSVKRIGSDDSFGSDWST